jgi:hypothetical protein
VGGQPVGIAQCETTRSPASEPTSPDIDKDFLDLFFSCRCSQTPEGAFGLPLDARLIAAEPTTAVPVLLQGDGWHAY